jgi:hypothetical protein
VVRNADHEAAYCTVFSGLLLLGVGSLDLNGDRRGQSDGSHLRNKV